MCEVCICLIYIYMYVCVRVSVRMYVICAFETVVKLKHLPIAGVAHGKPLLGRLDLNIGAWTGPIRDSQIP